MCMMTFLLSFATSLLQNAAFAGIEVLPTPDRDTRIILAIVFGLVALLALLALLFTAVAFVQMIGSLIRVGSQMHGGGHSLSPSEKLNHLSECGQSKYERDEIAPLPHALNPLFFGVTLADVLEAGISRGF